MQIIQVTWRLVENECNRILHQLWHLNVTKHRSVTTKREDCKDGSKTATYIWRRDVGSGVCGRVRCNSSAIGTCWWLQLGRGTSPWTRKHTTQHCQSLNVIQAGVVCHPDICAHSYIKVIINWTLVAALLSVISLHLGCDIFLFAYYCTLFHFTVPYFCQIENNC